MRATTVLATLLLMIGIGHTAQAKLSNEPVACRIELDRPLLPAGSEQTAVLKVTLDAAASSNQSKRPPVNLCVVLDRSSSMSGPKIEKAKEAAIVALRRLSSQDLFSLVVYNNDVETLVQAQTAANTDWIIDRIRNIQSLGNTALFGGVSQGASEVRKNVDNKYVNRIILLSDGQANVGPSSPAELGRLGTSLMKEGIAVTTVGLGNGYNEDLMVELAGKSDGNTYFAESSDDLPGIFAKELGDVLSVVAQKVILEIECLKGVLPIRLIGRDGRISENRAEIQLNQLYGGQEKFALLEVKIPAGNPKESLQLAAAHCRYINVNNQQPMKASAQANVAFTENVKEVIAHVNKELQVDLNYNAAVNFYDQAIKDADAGRNIEAAKSLRDQAVKLDEQAEYYDNDGLKEVSEELRKEADEIESNWNDRSRKNLKTKNQNLIQQQQTDSSQTP